MKYLLKVTVAITLLPLLIAVSYLPTYAQNTAPVPTTFEILSPSDSSLSFLMNQDYTRNRKIFYGGDFANLPGPPNVVGLGGAAAGFLGWSGSGSSPATAAELKSRGNAHLSRLTLGGTEFNDFPQAGSTPQGSYVTNLPGVYTANTSFDLDDIGGASGSFLVYTGANGFIAINEEDSLLIRLTGYVDPNNRFKRGSVAANGTFSGVLIESIEYAFDIANPKNDSTNGVRFGVVASTVPAGASFNGGIFRWVPNFIQGDGTFDNSNRNGNYFVDANISNGTTTSETADGSADTTAGATVGIGLGELRDSLYVVYFTATDDGIPPKTGQDSLFIMVNDSVKNPPPRFTTRNVVRPNGTVVNYTKSSIQFSPDSLLSYSEGDSLVITFNATDQDSIRGGGLNQALTFGVPNWARFIKRPTSHNDSLALDTNSVLVSGSPRALRVRIQVGYNVADTLGNNLPDTVRLVVSVVDESANTVNDTMLFKIANVNRAPIWDADTSSKPSDSALVYSFDPAAVEPDSIDPFPAIAIRNGVTDSIYFSQYNYDPDPLVHDSLGPGRTYTTSSSLGSFFSTTSGLLEILLTSEDTVSQSFPISVKDTDPNSPKTASIVLTLRVAPVPDVAEIYPHSGYPGQDITIFGTGFGLFDDSDSLSLSKVVFRSRNNGGTPENLRATINSWSRDRINATIPRNTAISQFAGAPINNFVPDTIEISTSVFNSPTLYPYVITPPDSTTIYQMEISNITSTSAVVKWRTAFTGIDSVVVATTQDTLDVTGTAPQYNIFKDANGNYYPIFVIPSADTLTFTRSTVQVFRGSTSTTDQVHVITLEDLVPSTKYQFIIAMKDNLFFGDTLRNVNGPYAPAKINRNNVGNGGIKGFLLETLPEQNSNGQTFSLAGKVVNVNGQAATGAVVTVQVIDKDNLADTTLPLTATVTSDSSWVVNLGNAAIDTTSDVTDRMYQHKQGDFLLITIAGDKDVGFTKFTTTRAATTPQFINLNGATTLLVAAVDYDIRLKVGLNLLGIPVNLFLTEPQTAKAVLTELTGGTPSITRYVTSTATQETIIKTIAGGSNQFIGASDWNLVASDGNYYDAYFLSIDQLNYLNFSGSVYGTALPVKLFPAPGLYWIARPSQTSSLFYAWSSRTMLSNIANATEIFNYNRDTQQYGTAVKDGSGAFIGTDFAIDVSEGYIINITAASQWDINTPLATQMANASVMFDNISGVTPSLTLDLSQASAVTGTGALRNIRLTDITSSAAKVSWVGNTSMNVQVRYGKATEGFTSLAQFKANDLKGGVGVQQLLGLKPETEYIYEIVSNGITYNDNGNPFTFKSAKIGIGEPYTVYGRLVDETGQPLADAVIYLSSKRNDEVSSTIAILTDEKGYWIANLANLKLANSGAVYAWKAGDEIRVTAIYGDASTSFRTLVSGKSPQNVIRVSDTDGVASTDKKEAAKVALPKAFALGQNYPNPFNPSTTIAFDIPEDKTFGVQVELKVFNVRGQVIRTLMNDTKQPGRYVIQWNGEDDNNEKVSSGVYFYRVKAGDYVATRKMVLLK